LPPIHYKLACLHYNDVFILATGGVATLRGRGRLTRVNSRRSRIHGGAPCPMYR